jgi:hypothetical protein
MAPSGAIRSQIVKLWSPKGPRGNRLPGNYFSKVGPLEGFRLWEAIFQNLFPREGIALREAIVQNLIPREGSSLWKTKLHYLVLREGIALRETIFQRLVPRDGIFLRKSNCQFCSPLGGPMRSLDHGTMGHRTMGPRDHGTMAPWDQGPGARDQGPCIMMMMCIRNDTGIFLDGSVIQPPKASQGHTMASQIRLLMHQGELSR